VFTVVFVGTRFAIECVGATTHQTLLANLLGLSTTGGTLSVGLLVSGQEQ
jgi:hypothetical protein